MKSFRDLGLPSKADLELSLRAAATPPESLVDAAPVVHPKYANVPPELKEPKDYSEQGLHEHSIAFRSWLSKQSEPPTVQRVPDGTIVANKWGKDPDEWFLNEVRSVPIKELETPELMRSHSGREIYYGGPTVDRYAKWWKEGSPPPPISVDEDIDGTLRVREGHHRVSAAVALGKTHIQAVVSPTVKTILQPSGNTYLKALALKDAKKIAGEAAPECFPTPPVPSFEERLKCVRDAMAASSG